MCMCFIFQSRTVFSERIYHASGSHTFILFQKCVVPSILVGPSRLWRASISWSFFFFLSSSFSFFLAIEEFSVKFQNPWSLHCYVSDQHHSARLVSKSAVWRDRVCCVFMVMFWAVSLKVFPQKCCLIQKQMPFFFHTSQTECGCLDTEICLLRNVSLASPLWIF